MAPKSTLVSEGRATPSRIVAWMVIAVALLGMLTFWDERQAAQAALADYGAEQAMIARAAAGSVRASLESHAGTRDDDAIRRSFATRLRALEQPGSVIVLVRPPGATGFLTLDGEPATSAPIEARFAQGEADGAWVRLTHADSAALGLPPRTAIAGIAEVDRGSSGPWSIVLVTSARRERDREERALWRVGLSFVLASAIVVTFGALALRKQRKEFELANRLAVAEAVHTRDERLVRADKLATLGALAAGIAHQVATPLGVIVGRAERLAPRVAHDEKAKHAVAVISEQAQRINRIVRAFLGLARGGVPSLERVEPEEIAHAAVELVSHRFEKAGVELDCAIEEPLPEISCDPRLFEQVIVNLLLNGCDACEDGGHVALSIQAVGETVTFVVEDDGVGITKEAAARATEPFFTTKPAGEGTGLGLAIAREIVTHHRGTLRLEPLAAGGTRASVEVPAAAKDGDA